MTSEHDATTQTTLRACTVAADLDAFAGLIDALDEHVDSAWGELTFEEAAIYLEQPEAATLEFVVLAIGAEEAEKLGAVGGCLRAARRQGVPVIVVTADLGAAALHRLMRLGAADFLPYPLPAGALPEALDRLERAGKGEATVTPIQGASGGPAKGAHSAVVIPIHGLAGGAGATTLAVNLAWELANVESERPPRVCVIDLDLQFGGVATSLDLPRQEIVTELLTDAARIDDDALLSAVQTYERRLHVLTAPSEILPLDVIGPDEVERLIETARTNFDYVVIDMPQTLCHWTEAVLGAATFCLAPLELDLRSAQNALRLVKALKAEELPHEKLRFVLNRAPKLTDLTGRARAKRLAESLDVKIEIHLPDGGKPAAQAGDHGRPLSEVAPKNPLRREIARLATQIHETNTAAETQAA